MNPYPGSIWNSTNVNQNCDYYSNYNVGYTSISSNQAISNNNHNNNTSIVLNNNIYNNVNNSYHRASMTTQPRNENGYYINGNYNGNGNVSMVPVSAAAIEPRWNWNSSSSANANNVTIIPDYAMAVGIGMTDIQIQQQYQYILEQQKQQQEQLRQAQMGFQIAPMRPMATVTSAQMKFEWPSPANDRKKEIEKKLLSLDCLLKLVENNNHYYKQFKSLFTREKIDEFKRCIQLEPSDMSIYRFIQRKLERYYRNDNSSHDSNNKNTFERFEYYTIDVPSNRAHLEEMQYIACMIDFIWFFQCKSHSLIVLYNCNTKLDEIITYCDDFMPDSIKPKYIREIIFDKCIKSWLLPCSKDYNQFEYYRCYYNILGTLINQFGVEIFPTHSNGDIKYIRNILDIIENLYLNVLITKKDEKLTMNEMKTRLNSINEMHCDNKNDIYKHLTNYPLIKIKILDKIVSAMNEICFDKFESVMAQLEHHNVGIDFLLDEIMFPFLTVCGNLIHFKIDVVWRREYELPLSRLIESIIYYDNNDCNGRDRHNNGSNMYNNMKFYLFSKCLQYINNENIFKFKGGSHVLIKYIITNYDKLNQHGNAFNCKQFTFLSKLFFNNSTKHFCQMKVRDLATPSTLQHVIKIYLKHSKSYLTQWESYSNKFKYNYYDNECLSLLSFSSIETYLAANIYEDIINEYITHLFNQVANVISHKSEQFMNVDSDSKDILSIIKSYTIGDDVSLYLPIILKKTLTPHDIDSNLYLWFNGRNRSGNMYKYNVNCLRKWREYFDDKQNLNCSYFFL